MNDRPGILSPESLPRPGEVALLTAIDAVLEAVPGTRRVTFQVVAQMLVRDASRESPANAGDHFG